MKPITKPFLTILFTLISHFTFSQKQNVAVIVDENSGKFDVVFFSKIILLFIIAIIALISFINYQKEESSAEVE